MFVVESRNQFKKIHHTELNITVFGYKVVALNAGSLSLRSLRVKVIRIHFQLRTLEGGHPLVCLWTVH